MESVGKLIFKAMIAFIGTVTLLYLALTFYLGPDVAEYEAKKAAYAGEVVDKEIINAKSGWFTSSDTDYRVVIKVEYEYDGEVKETTKSFSVDKETYLSADVGDVFDSHSLEVTKQRSEESAAVEGIGENVIDSEESGQPEQN